MNNFKLALLATSVAAVGATAFAGTSEAIYTQLDGVRLEAEGYVLAGVSSEQATVLWDETGEGVQPHFSGKLHLDGVSGQCARVRMISYELDGGEIGDRLFAPSDDEESFCASDDGHFAREVSLVGPDDVHEVKLTLQTWINDPEGGHWSNLVSQTVEYGPQLPASDVLIEAGRFDLGAGTLVNGVPSEAAELTWDVSTGWIIDPELNATLFVRNARNQELRVVFTCYDAAGDALPGETDGDLSGEYIYPQSSDDEIPIVRRCGDSAVAEVGVTIELKNVSTGQFEVRGEQRIPLPSVFPQLPPIDFDPIPL